MHILSLPRKSYLYIYSTEAEIVEEIDDMMDVVTVEEYEEPDVIVEDATVEGYGEEDAKAAVRLMMDRHGWSYRSVNDMLRLFRLHPNLAKFKTVYDILDRNSLPKVETCKVCSECHDVVSETLCDW